ncbi:MAG: hypothetical protein ACREVE_15505 [Gammaproteobacteria bacterium]
MKIARLPFENGNDVYVVMHNLAIHEARFRKFRPIHVLTHVGQFHKAVTNREETFLLGLALENKLFAVAHYATLLCEAITPLSVHLYEGHYIRDYEPTQKVVAVIEGYIGAIYSALEVVALFNKSFDRALPQGFRRQTRKVEAFSLVKQDWLKHFFDIRSELAHYNSPLPMVSQQKLILEFRNPSPLEMFKKGRYEIGFDAIISYAPSLFAMLDAWALQELKNVDENAELNVVHEAGWKKPLKSKNVSVKSLLKELDV